MSATHITAAKPGSGACWSRVCDPASRRSPGAHPARLESRGCANRETLASTANAHRGRRRGNPVRAPPCPTTARPGWSAPETPPQRPASPPSALAADASKTPAASASRPSARLAPAPLSPSPTLAVHACPSPSTSCNFAATAAWRTWRAIRQPALACSAKSESPAWKAPVATHCFAMRISARPCGPKGRAAVNQDHAPRAWAVCRESA